MILDELVEVLGLDIRADDLDGYQKRLSSTIKQGAALIGVSFGVAAAIRSVLDTAGDTAGAVRFAAANDVSVRSLQRLRFAAKDVGVEASSVDSLLGSLGQRSRAAIAGQDGGTASLFAQLGIDLRDSNGELKAADRLLLDISDSLARTSNNPYSRTIAEQLGITPELNLLMRRGSARINQLGDEAERTGVVLSEGAGRAAVRFQKGIDKLGASINGMLTENGTPLLNWITGLVEGFRRFLQSDAGKGAIGFFTKLSEAIGSLLSTPVDVIKGIGSAINSAFDIDSGGKIAALGAGFVALGIAIGPTAILAIAALAALQDLVEFAKGNEDTLTGKYLKPALDKAKGPSEFLGKILDFLPGNGVLLPPPRAAVGGAAATGGGGVVVGEVRVESEIHIDGAQSPEATADAVGRQRFDAQTIREAFESLKSGQVN